MAKWIIYLLAILPLALAAQDLAEPGYIVLNSGDTLKGEVQHIKETFSGITFLRKIRFRNENGKKKKYSRSELRGFRSGELAYRKYHLQTVRDFTILKSYYEIVPYGGEITFLRVLKEGPLSHFEYEWIDGTDDYVSSFPLLKRSNETILVRSTQGIFGLKKKVLYGYFSDCPELQQHIEDETFKRTFEVVNFYNNQCEQP